MKKYIHTINGEGVKTYTREEFKEHIKKQFDNKEITQKEFNSLMDKLK